MLKVSASELKCFGSDCIIVYEAEMLLALAPVLAGSSHEIRKVEI
jgi:hypothetical protein